MAMVYIAHDLRHDRQVAITVLEPELAAVLGAERFVVEIKTTAGVRTRTAAFNGQMRRSMRVEDVFMEDSPSGNYQE
jgi:hypothetical protein